MSITASAAAALNVSSVSTPVVVSDTGINVATYLDSLHNLAAANKLASITLTDTGTPSIAVTAAKLLGDSDALLRISNSNWAIALSGTATAAQAVGANSTLVAKLNTGFAVSDTAANVAANLAALQALVSGPNKLASIDLTGTGPILTITTAALMANAGALGKITTSAYSIAISSGTVTAAQVVALSASVSSHLASSLVVSDTSAGVASNIDGLQAVAAMVASITLTNASPVLSLTAAQLVADATALLKIGGTYGITVSGTATAAQAAAVRNPLIVKLTAGLAVSDTAANVVSNLTSLQDHVSWLASIVLTDASPNVSLTADQLISGAAALLKISGTYSITVSGTATAAQAIGANATLVGKLSAGFAVSDTVANVSSNLDILQAHAGAIASIALSDSSPALSLTVAQLISDSAVLLKIGGTYALTVSGTATAAQAVAVRNPLIVKLSAGLNVSDSVANVLSNLAGLQAHGNWIASVALTDSSPVLSLTAAQLIANAAILLKVTGSYNITLSGIATIAQAVAANSTLASKLTAGLAVSDVSVNLVSNIGALQARSGTIASVVLTDASPVLSLTATQLIADAGILQKIGGGYAISLSGTATVAQVTGANSTLVGHLSAGFAMSDTSANVAASLDALQARSGTITSIMLTDASPVLSLTAAQLVADAGLLLKINGSYGISVSGTATVAQVTGTNSILAGYLSAGFAISDSAANLAGSLDTLQSRNASIASIVLTDMSPVVSLTTTQLLADATVLLKIGGSYGITLSGTATVAQATGANATLAGHLSSGFAISDTSANVAVSLDALQARNASIASIALTDGSPVVSLTAAQLTADAAVLLKISGSYGIAVSGTATVAQVTGANSTLVGHLSAGFAISDTSANVAGSLDMLQARNASIASIALTDGSPVVSMTATQLIADAAVLLKISGSYGITLSGPASASQAAAANSTLVGKLTAGIVVSDSAANVTGSLAGLQTLAAAGKLGAITLTDGGTPALSMTATTLAADAGALAAITSAYTITISSGALSAANALALNTTVAGKVTSGLAVSDTATAVSTNADALQAVSSEIGTIALTGSSPVVSLTTTQLLADATVLLKIAGSYGITLSGTATVAQATGANATLAGHLSSGFAISDSAANLAGSLDTLQSRNASIASIALTDGSPVVSLTAAQLTADAAVLLKISGSYGIAVSGTATVAQVTGANSTLVGHLSSGFAISDTSANVAVSLDALQARSASIASIALTDGSPVVSMTATQLIADAAALLKISGSYGITLSGPASASQAAAANSTLVGKLTAGIVVSDSAANVTGSLAGLQTLAAAGKLGAITLTDGGTPALSMTATTLAADAGALAAITSAYTITISSGALSVANALALNTTVAGKVTSGLPVADTSANVSGHLDALQALGGTLASIVLSDNAPVVTVTASMLVADAIVLAKISTTSYSIAISSGSVSVAQALVLSPGLMAHVAASLVVSDSSAQVVGNLGALQVLNGAIGSIVLTDTSPVLSLTIAQLAADAAVLLKITGGYHISVAGTVTVAQALGVSSTLVGNLSAGFAISDTSANVAGSLDALQGRNASIASIALTDGSPVLSLTAGQLGADATVLLKIGSAFHITLSGTATVAQVVAVSGTLIAMLTTGFAISDTAANVVARLDALQALGGSVASITLTGGSPVLSLTAAQLTADAAVLLKISGSYGIAVSGTATVAQVTGANSTLVGHLSAGFAISDTSANVAGSLDMLQARNASIASIALTDGSPVVSMTATQLIADAAVLLKISGSYGITLSGPASASQAAAANSTLVGKLTAGIVVSDSAANVTGSLAGLQTLAAAGKLGAITLTDGGTPALSMTATTLAADAGALAAITSAYTITISSGALSAANALALNTTVAGKVTSGLAVSDTATAVSTNADALQAVSSEIGTIALTGSSPVVSLTTTQLLADATVLLKIAGSYGITLSGTATVAQATGANATLAGHLSSGFAISDTSANVAVSLDALQARNASIASIALTDGSPVVSLTAAQLIADAAALLKISGSYGIAVSGTATVAQVTGANSTLVGHLSSGFAISDTSANLAGSLDALQARSASIASIALTDGSPVVSMTATQLIADAAALLKISGSYGITLSGPASASQAAAANSTLVGKLTAGIVVSDSAANVTGSLAGLQTLAAAGKLGAITLTDGGTPALSMTATTLAADAGALAAITSAYTITISSGALSVANALALNTTVAGKVTSGLAVSDTATAVSTNADALQAVSSEIGTIALTGSSPVVSLTTTQLLADATVLLKIAGSYGITLSGPASASQAAAANSTLVGKLTAGIVVSDSAANVTGSLAGLQTLAAAGKLGAITLTDGGTPALSMTATTLIADAGALAAITSAYTITISSGILSVANVLALNTVVAGKVAGGLAVTDTAAAVGTNIGALQAVSSEIGSIALTDSTPVVSLTAAQLVADATVLLKITGSYHINLSSFPTAMQAVSANSTLVSQLSAGFSVHDSAANITASLSGLQTLAAATKLASVTLTDTGTPALSISAGTLAADNGALATIAGSYTLNVSGILTAAQAVGINTGVASHVTGGLQITDSAAHVATNINQLESIIGSVGSITLTDTGTPALSISSSALVADAAVLAKISGSYSLTVAGTVTVAQILALDSGIAAKVTGGLAVSDTSATVSTNLSALQALGTVVASVSLTGSPATFAVTATELGQDGGVLAKIITGGASLVADGARSAPASAAANLNSAPVYTGTLLFGDTAAMVATYLDALQALATGGHLGTILLTDGVTPTLSITATRLQNDGGALAHIGSSYNLAIASGTLTAAQAIGISSSVLSHASAALSVNDTSANIVSNLDALQTIAASIGSVSFSDGTPTLTLTAAKITSDINVLAIASGYSLSVTGGSFTAAQAATLSTTPVAAHLSSGAVVSDTATNVSAMLSSLKTLADISKLGPITLTDVSVLPVSPAQLLADLSVFRKITNNYTFSVSPALTAAQAASVNNLLTPRLPANLTVNDSAANVFNNLDALEALALGAHLGSVTLTDGGTPQLHVSADQLTSDADVLADLVAPYQLLITGSITAAQAASYSSHMSRLGTPVAVLDSAAAVQSNLAGLATLATSSLLTSITFTDTGTPTLTLTASAFATGGAALSTIIGNYGVTISGGTLTPAQLASAATNGLLALVSGTINVSDTGSAIVSSLSSLLTNIAKIGTITVSDSGTPLVVTSAMLAADGAVFAKIGTYTATVSDTIGTVAVSSINTGYASHLASNALTVSDTAANVNGVLSTLTGLGSKIHTVTVTTAATAAQAVAIAAGLSSYLTSTIAVSDTGSAIVSSLSSLLTNLSNIGSITVSDSGTPLVVTSAMLAADGAVFAKIGTYTATVSDTIGTVAVSSINTGYASHLASNALTVSDTAANVNGVLSTLTGLGSKIHTVTVTTAATAAQAVAIAAGLSSYLTSTIAVSDTGSAIVSSLSSLLTNLSNIGSITVSDSGTPLVVTSAMLAADGAVFAKIGTYTATVSDTIGTVAVSSINTGYASHLASNALTVSDTAANVNGVLSTLTGLGSKIHTVTVTTAATAAQAVAIAAGLSSYLTSTIAVSDTGSAIVSSLSSLLTNLSNIGSITVSDSGTPLVVTSAMLAADGAVFAKIGTYTATVSDTIGTVAVSSINTGYASHLASNALTVSDTAANVNGVLSTLTGLGSKIHTVTVTTAATAAQAVAIAAGLSSYLTSTIAVSDTGSAIVSSLSSLLTNLSNIGSITVSDSGTPLVVTSAMLAADGAVFAKIGTYTATVSDTIGTVAVSSINTGYASHLASNALTVSDTAANVNGVLSTLTGLGSKIHTVTVTTAATAAQAVAIAAGLSSYLTSTIAVSDTGASIVSSLSSLLTNLSNIGSITVSDSGTPLVVTSAMLAADGAVFAKIGTYTATVSDTIGTVAVSSINTGYASHLASNALTVSDTAANVNGVLSTLTGLGSKIHTVTVTTAATAAQAVAIAAGLSSYLTSTIAVSDTGASIVSSLSSLLTNLSNIGSITVSDSGTPLVVTSAMLAADGAVFAKIGTYTATVSDTIGTVAVSSINTGYASHLASNALTVSDTAANVNGVLSTLTGLGSKIHTVTVTTAATAAQAVAIAAGLSSYLTSTIAVSDTGASIVSSLSSLLTNLSNIGSITVSDSGTPLVVTSAMLSADGAVFAKISTYTATVSDSVSTSAATTLNGGSYSSHLAAGALTVSDTAAHVYTDRVAVAALTTKLNTVTVTTAATAAQAAAIVTSLNANLTGQVAVTDTASRMMTNIDALQTLATGSKLGTLTISTAAAALNATLTQVASDTTAINAVMSATGANSNAVLYVQGTSGDDTIDASGLTHVSDISLGTNGETMTFSSGVGTLTGTGDRVTLGSATSSVEYTANSGVEVVTGFQFGTDVLNLNLNAISASHLAATDVTVGGVSGIALIVSDYSTQGVLLMNTGISASTLTSDHLFTAGSHVLIS